MKKGFLVLCFLTAVVSVMLWSGNQPKGAAENRNVTVRLLTDESGIDDKSLNAAAWQGILDFYGDTWQDQRQRGILYDVMTAETTGMYASGIRRATDEGCDLVITAGSEFSRAIFQVAMTAPDQKYLIIGTDSVQLFNVLNVVFAEHEGSFLVGAAAALKALADGIRDPVFGFIGGIPCDAMTKFEVGYIQGILAVIPGAKFRDYYADSWSRPDLAKAQAKKWYDDGVYAIYSVGGVTAGGVIDQAREYRTGGRNVWAIGADSDQYGEGLYGDGDSAVLTSMLKRVDAGVLYGLRAVQNRTFKGEVVVLDMNAGGVEYSRANPALTEDIVDRLEQFKRLIVNGRIRVAFTRAEAGQLPGFPRNLDAKDG
jgi:basic membrane protein A